MMTADNVMLHSKAGRVCQHCGAAESITDWHKCLVQTDTDQLTRTLSIVETWFVDLRYT